MNHLLHGRKASNSRRSLGWAVKFTALGCLALAQFVGRGSADDDRDSKEAAEKARVERAARQEAMRRRAASLVARVQESDDYRPADLVEAPLLHYNNLAGKEFDATLWAWGKLGRPIAIATIAVHHGQSQIWNCEMVSLVDKPVAIAGKTGWEWSPKKSALEWKPVVKGPVPAKTPVARLVQMKDIAEQFSATGYYRNGNTIELRLMSRPLHRYADPDAGLVDGALFTFAEGTNPEVLMLVECRQDGAEKPVWKYACARMSGGRLVTRLGDATVWECPDVQGWFPERPYSSINGQAEEVFGPEME